MSGTEQYKLVITISGSGQDAVASIDSVNKKLKETEKDATSANNASRSLGQTWSSFKDHATNFLGAATLVTAVTAQIYGLGRASQAAELTFNQVSGGADLAAASLSRMRQLTGGVIDDMSLMKGASSLLVTGIAQTNEQAEELVNLGARLGSVMGVDAAESIANLNSALLNNSFLRLDTLGISAARVRERVNELKEAGLDMSAAFSQAVIEIGGQTLEDLGAAAGVAETAVARLATRVQNFGQNAAEVMATGLEKAAISLEQLIALSNLAITGQTGIAEIDARLAQMRELTELTAQYDTQIRALDDSVRATSSLQEVDEQLVTEFIAASPELASTFATTGEEASTYFRDAFNSGNEQMIAEARQMLREAGLDEFADASIERLRYVADPLDIAFTSSANAVRDLNVELEATNAALDEQNRILNTQSTVAETSGMILRRVTSELNDIIHANNTLSDTLQGGMFSNATGSMTFFDASQLDEVQTQTQAIVDEYERLKDLAESSEFTLVSEDEVNRARIIAENAEQTAQDAERFAAAFERASLSQLLGATDGGRENEFYQGVLANIEDPELRAATEHQFNLQSGVENANTMVADYAEALSTALIEEFGAGRGAQLGKDVYTAMEEGIRLGFSGEDLKNYIEGEVGYALSSDGTGTGGQQITVQQGEGYLALAERTGYTVEELKAETGGRMLMAGEVLTIGDSQLIALDENSATQSVNSAASNIRGGFGDSNIVAISQDSAAPIREQSTSDYTYFDPATGEYSYSNDPAPIIAPETAETVATVEDDMLSIETSITNISETDTSTAIDPLISDTEEAVEKIDEFSSKLTAIADMDLSLQIPLEFIMTTEQAEWLARNSSVVEVFRLVLPQLGLTPS